MSKVELRNGSVIETLESSRPKRGQRRELITIADVIPEDATIAIEETLEWLKLENKAGDLAIKALEQEITNLKNALSRMLELRVYPTAMIENYDEWLQFENECKILANG